MKSAIVGFGVIGRVHYEVLKNSGNPAVAVCDLDRSRIDGLLDVSRYTDYIEMLDSVKPDVVHICTPHYLHEQMIIAALERGVNVLCEKPLCISLDGIERILAAEKNSKAILGVCHQNRYNLENVFLKSYLKDKKVVSGYGTVIWNRTAEYYLKDEWRGKWKTEGGGVLINQALHTFDLMQWLIGFPKTVTASISNLTLNGSIEVEDTASVICSGEAEFSFFATNGSGASFPVTLTIKTEEETINVFSGKVIIGDKVYEFKGNDKVLGKACYGVGHEGLIKDFYDCVKTGRKFSIDGTEAAKVIKLILAAYKSGGEKINVV